MKEKTICDRCGKKFNKGKRNYSIFCNSCRHLGLKGIAESKLKEEI